MSMSFVIRGHVCVSAGDARHHGVGQSSFADVAKKLGKPVKVRSAF